MQARSQHLQVHLDLLVPGPRDLPSAPRIAFQQITNQRKESRSMSIKRPIWAALAVILALALVFTLTPASAWASSFLNLFRVQKVTVVSFDPAAVQGTQDTLSGQNKAIQQIFKDNLVITKQGETQSATSPEEAAKLAGFTPHLLDPQGSLGAPQLSVKPGTQAKFTIDQAKLQAIIDATGSKLQLPKEVDGQIVTADVPTSVEAVYGGCPVTDPTRAKAGEGKDCTLLVQLPSPTVNAPAELDVQKLGEAMFQVLGYPEDQAASMSSSIDWATTLVLPFPQGQGMSSQDVAVDGTTGTLLLGDDQSSNHYTIIWTKGGMLYALSGPGGQAEAQKAADLLQ
jgi:hypothetical protein